MAKPIRKMAKTRQSGSLCQNNGTTSPERVGPALGGADYSAFYRSPDIKLVDIRFAEVRLRAPFNVFVDEPERTMLYQVRRGQTWLEFGDRVVNLSAGTIVGIEVGRRHVFRDKQRDIAAVPLASRQVNVCADRGVASGVLEMMQSSVDRRSAVLRSLDGGLLVVNRSGEPENQMLYVLRDAQDLELALGPQRDEGIISRLSEAITICLVRLVRTHSESKFGQLPLALKHDERILKAYIAFLRNLAHPWTTAMLAAVAGLSRTAFATRFKVVVGEPPLQSLARLRLQRAGYLLLQGRSTLLDVANAVGYQNAATLIRAFRAVYGMTPGAWRAEHRDKLGQTLSERLGN